MPRASRRAAEPPRTAGGTWRHTAGLETAARATHAEAAHAALRDPRRADCRATAPTPPPAPGARSPTFHAASAHAPSNALECARPGMRNAEAPRPARHRDES